MDFHENPTQEKNLEPWVKKALALMRLTIKETLSEYLKCLKTKANPLDPAELYILSTHHAFKIWCSNNNQPDEIERFSIFVSLFRTEAEFHIERELVKELRLQ